MVTQNNINSPAEQYKLLVGTGSGFTQISAGSAGEVLTSGGPSANPSFQPASGGGSTDPVGTLKYFSTSGGTSFTDYLACDGSILSQASYTLLYSKIGLLNGNAQVWTQRTPAITGVSYFTGTVYSNVFYLGAELGIIQSSTDGISWTFKSQVASGTCNNLIYSTQFVANIVNQGIYTSTDASTWTRKTTYATGIKNTLAYNGSIYFLYNGNPASAGKHNFITSTDLITWDNRASLPNPNNFSPGMLNGSTYVLGMNANYATSTDFITWYSTTPNPSTSMIYGTKFVTTGTGNACEGYVYTSTDFNNWKIIATGTTSSLNALTYGTVYVAAGAGGVLYSSTDAETWTSRTSGTTSIITALTYGTLYVYGGFGGVLRTSTDAITWDSRTSGTTSSIFSLAYGNGIYLYGAAGGGLSTSTDGITWTARTSGSTTTITNITYGNGVYVYSNGNGAISSSTDGITWTARTVPTFNTISSLIYSNNKFVYVTSGDASVVTSTDGTTWAANYSRISTGISKVVYTTNYYLTNSFQKATSTDGYTWTQIKPVGLSLTEILTNAVFADSKYTFVTTAGSVATSTDLNTWTNYTGPNAIIGNLSYGTVWIANQSTGMGLYTSTNLQTWNQVSTPQQPSPTFAGLTYGLYDNGTYVFGGYNNLLNLIVTSKNTYSYNSATQFQLPNDAQIGITTEYPNNFQRKLYIKYQ